MPTIGVTTIENLHAAGGRCLALAAGDVIIVDRERTIETADRLGVSIVGVPVSYPSARAPASAVFETSASEMSESEQTPCPYVGRGGLKLRHALDVFSVDVDGWRCADLGCSTGGFTDCLLQAGAATVFSVDTAYGQLAWRLRQDERVTVMERSNALHVEPPALVKLVVIDLGWTQQGRSIPAARRWLDSSGSIISLVKPHYEVAREELGPGGILDRGAAERTLERVLDEMPGLGVAVRGVTESPLLGGQTGKRKKGKGNAEWLVLLEPC